MPPRNSERKIEDQAHAIDLVKTREETLEEQLRIVREVRDAAWNVFSKTHNAGCAALHARFTKLHVFLAASLGAEATAAKAASADS